MRGRLQKLNLLGQLMLTTLPRSGPCMACNAGVYALLPNARSQRQI